MRKWIIFVGLAMLISACATPQQQPTAQTTQQAQPQMEVARGTQPENQKLICSTSYPMGSHIPQRICVTPAEAAARKRAAQEAMQNLQMKGAQDQGSALPPT